jgi:hypothetical protein
MSFKDFIQKNKENGLATFTEEELESEQQRRKMNENIFPLEVFHPKTKPFINALNQSYDLHRSYIGLAILSSYSTAIGTAYTVSTNGKDEIFLPVWGCLLGLSSSGKSLSINKAYEPLKKIQDEFNLNWDIETQGITMDQMARKNMPQLLYRDIQTPTLIRYVIPDNPKGLCKIADELLEWVNGMNPAARNKDGTDEQFWLSTWNCTQYDAVRSGKQKFVNKRPFVNIVGGTQYDVLPNFFSKNRDTTGFIFRLLFAIDDRNKIIEIDPHYDMAKEVSDPHENVLRTLYQKLKVESTEEIPGKCILTREAVDVYHGWVRTHVRKINEMEDLKQRELQSGIFGKIKEYALRFSAILHLTDVTFDNSEREWVNYKPQEFVSSDVMHRAIKLAQYFHFSAETSYERVQKQRYAPHDAIVCANLLRKLDKRFSLMQIAGILYNKETEANKSKVKRNLKKWMFEYPWLFNSKER